MYAGKEGFKKNGSFDFQVVFFLLCVWPFSFKWFKNRVKFVEWIRFNNLYRDKGQNLWSNSIIFWFEIVIFPWFEIECQNINKLPFEIYDSIEFFSKLYCQRNKFILINFIMHNNFKPLSQDHERTQSQTHNNQVHFIKYFFGMHAQYSKNRPKKNRFGQ